LGHSLLRELVDDLPGHHRSDVTVLEHVDRQVGESVVGAEGPPRPEAQHLNIGRERADADQRQDAATVA
jgi:hypothetical protein